MTPGKSASQAGHAFLESFVKADRATGMSYLKDGGTKIALSAPNLSTIQNIYDAAIAAGLPCALVVESGHIMPPVFDGEPVVTAVGIGPVERSAARGITKKLRLMQ